MRIAFKKLCCVGFSLMMMLCSFTSVYAMSSAEAQQALGISEATKDIYQAVFNAFLSEGYTDKAAAAILGNLACESGFKGAAVESGNTAQGIGIAQWSTVNNQTALQTWSSKCGHKLTTITCANGTFTICTDEACQAAFLISQLQSDWIGNSAKYNEKAVGVKDRTWDSIGGGLITYRHVSDAYKKLPQNVETYESPNTFKKASDLDGATISVFDNYERGKGINYLVNGNDVDWFLMEHMNRCDKAVYCLACWGNGKSVEKKSTNNKKSEKETEAATTIAEQMSAQGFWNEEQLSSYCKLYELNVQDILDSANRESLDQSSLTNLANWENNVGNNDSEDTIIIKFLRTLVQVMGIWLTLRMSLLYLAFWFDRINNIFDFDLLGRLSYGRLHVAADDSEATYSKGGTGKDGKTVSHKDILKIILISYVFGALILTGTLYGFIAAIVNFTLSLFS